MDTQTDISPRAARTRAALVKAGFELLAAKPVDAIPINEVVAKAGVGKGSFFNHFDDKQAFAAALAAEVRLELEERIAQFNIGEESPLKRIAGGMYVGASFAIEQPKRAAVLLRSLAGVSGRAHRLNQGIARDFDAACERGLLTPKAAQHGVLYWLGLCQALMVSLIDQPATRVEQEERICTMIAMGLTGLGVDSTKAGFVARYCSEEKYDA